MNPNRKYFTAIGVFIILCGLSALAGSASDGSARWYSVVPSLVAVLLAFVTGRLMLSLGAAVVSGMLLSLVPEGLTSLSALTSSIVNSLFDWYSFQILAFVLLMMAMISVVLHAGGLQGIVERLARYARGPRSTQVVTVLMGFAIFFDDYANTMIVGNAMRPVSDRYGVSREKLAFLVDATAAPIAGIAFISTWVGYEVAQFSEIGNTLGFTSSEVTGFSMFFDAIPFRFYCILMICFVVFNVVTGRDFGPMRKAEKRAAEKGEVSSPDAQPLSSKGFSGAEPHPEAIVSARTALIPLLVMLGCVIVGFWLDGGGGKYFRENIGSLASLTVWRDVISHSENNMKILAWAAFIGLFLSVVCAKVFAGIKSNEIGKSTYLGLKGGLLPMGILVLAIALKEVCTSLQTGEFLVSMIGDSLPVLVYPSLLFVASAFVAFATGTSWGTMGILIPIGIPVAYQLDGSGYGLVTMLSLAAILDGSIMGDHCSPISDTTILSSVATSCDHRHHVSTQLPYALVVGGVAVVCGYLPAAAGVSSPLLLGCGALLLLLSLLVIGSTRSVHEHHCPNAAK